MPATAHLGDGALALYLLTFRLTSRLDIVGSLMAKRQLAQGSVLGGVPGM